MSEDAHVIEWGWKDYIRKQSSDDTELRKVANIPDDAYYTVSVWPVAGRVTIDHRRSRSVPKAKISKSNQT
jgi:hypothetical protein